MSLLLSPSLASVKTHFPRVPADDATSPSTYTKAHSFDQAVHLLRNPIDSIYSEWQLAHSLQNGQLDHAARLEIGLLGAAGPQGVRQKLEALRYARNWARHEAFWRAAPVPVHRVRYEDLMQYKLPTLMGVLAFLLPPEQLPSLSNVACIVSSREMGRFGRACVRGPRDQETLTGFRSPRCVFMADGARRRA